VGGSVFGGWSTSHERAAALFPLEDNGERVGPVHERGRQFHVELASTYRLTDHWALRALVRLESSPQYAERMAGVSLQFNASPRSALFNTDLPSYP
jgi:hypothetical protein